MFKNNLKIAWRSLLKDKRFTLLNLAGLSTGLACALMIYLWAADELSYDKFFKNGDRIYQLMESRHLYDQVDISDESGGLLGKLVKEQMPEVQYAVTLVPTAWFQKFTLTVGEKNIKAVGQYVGADYFKIFSYPMLEGDPGKVLQDKSSIVISEDLARRLFGTTEHLIGKAIRFQHDTTFFVSGVFENIPEHSSQQFDFVLSFEYYGDLNNWVRSWNGGPHSFVLLREGANPEAFNKRIAGIITRNSDDTTRKAFAMPFADSYLKNTFVHGARVSGRMEYIRLFSIIAVFILAIACINFMNLSTAKASKRLKEVGIKKVVGAGRKQLVFQFMGESLLLSFISLIFAFVLMLVLLPRFNQLTGKHLSLLLRPNLLLGVLGITLLTGLLAGSYPALYLSGFNPISILKNKLKTSMGEVWVRKGLVVFQFSIAIVLIISVMVVYKQIHLIQSINLGFNKENIIRFRAEGTLLQNRSGFMDELKKIPGVVEASYTGHDMIGRNFGGDLLSWPGKNPNGLYYFEGMGTGYDFIETLGMQMLQGRSFSKAFGNDSANVIVNEAAVKTMGLKNPLGKIVKFFNQNVQIVGVVKDFHFESLHRPVVPLVMWFEGQGGETDKIMVRISNADQAATIARVQDAYEKFNPGFPFEFNFLDEAYQKQYDSEKRVSILSRYFAVLAIVISCLGIFGLAAFTAQRRQKEIGIRKVIGASVGGIFMMLSRDFFFLVLLAILIAFPLSWWAMHQWLEGFVNRVQIGFLVFLFAGVSILLITMITISLQAARAAKANPVKSLRTE